MKGFDHARLFVLILFSSLRIPKSRLLYKNDATLLHEKHTYTQSLPSAPPPPPNETRHGAIIDYTTIPYQQSDAMVMRMLVYPSRLSLSVSFKCSILHRDNIYLCTWPVMG